MNAIHSPREIPNHRRALKWILLGLLALVLLGVTIAAVNLLRAPASSSSSVAEEVWTCSMHPQVRLPKPGSCPICAMPLIRAAGQLEQPKEQAAASHMLTLGEHGRVMASVETAPVERRRLKHEIRAVGKVQYNERGMATITARVDGYIERLFVDFTGVDVKQGDHLVEIYSPELLVAQQELLFNPASTVGGIADAVKLKLRRWELTDEQIEEIVRTRKAKERITLQAPVAGTVVEKMVVQKSAVKTGDVLYRLANLESVWVYLDIYEHELGLVRYGQAVEVRSEAWPAESFSGRVWFVNPFLTDESRSVKVLVNIANTEKRLKPGMFVSATIRAGLLADGSLAPTGIEGQWTCAMHPQVLRPEGGACPICNMDLVQIPPRPASADESELGVLSLPVGAVLDSGARKIAYVEREPGQFEPAEIEVGPRAGAYYPVISGVAEGDRVATRGAFLLDSQFQIQGLPSLFYPAGQAAAVGHQHGTPGASAKDKPAPAVNPAPASAGEHKH